jgi:hypothetical protein
MSSTAVDKYKIFEQLKYVPHPKQRLAHDAEERFRILCCGRRFGKSHWAGHEITTRMFVPDSVNWIVGPDYSLGEKEFRVVWQDFQKLGLMKYCAKSNNVKQGNMRIHFKDLNSVLEVKSAERPDSLVGEGLDHVCMSEAAKHKMSTWQMYIEPALADKRGTADFPSTPEGFNWYEGLYQVGQSPDERFSDYISWRFPTWENIVKFPGGFDPQCPNIDQDAHIHHKDKPCNCNEELVRIMNSGVSWMYWLQEYAAEFTAFEGMIYPEFNELIHVQEFEYDPAKQNWWALDFGYTDPFICLDIMVDSTQRVYVWREYVETGRSTFEHGQILKARESPEGFHVDGIAADPRGPDEIATLAWIIGAIYANAQGIALGVEEIKKHMKMRDDGFPGLIIHPRCERTIRSIKNLHGKPGASGYEVARGQDDHCADALRYFFNEYFVFGGGSSLVDVYSGYERTEAAGFFKYVGGITLNR